MTACGAERAVSVAVTVGVEGDTLCLLAGDGDSLAFVAAYAVATLPDPATLTFVPGPASTSIVAGRECRTIFRVSTTPRRRVCASPTATPT